LTNLLSCDIKSTEEDSGLRRATLEAVDSRRLGGYTVNVVPFQSTRHKQQKNSIAVSIHTVKRSNVRVSGGQRTCVLLGPLAPKKSESSLILHVLGFTVALSLIAFCRVASFVTFE